MLNPHHTAGRHRCGSGRKQISRAPWMNGPHRGGGPNSPLVQTDLSMFAKTSEQSQRDSNPCRHLERARRFIAGGSSPSNGVAFLRLETATVDDEWHHLRSPGTSCNRVVG